MLPNCSKEDYNQFTIFPVIFPRVNGSHLHQVFPPFGLVTPLINNETTRLEGVTNRV